MTGPVIPIGPTISTRTSTTSLPEIPVVNLPIGVGLKGEPGSSGNVQTMPLNGVSSISIDHNLGYFPIVAVFDSSGEEWDTDVRNVSVNTVHILFSAPFTGSVTYA